MVDAFPIFSKLKEELNEQDQRTIRDDWARNRTKIPVTIIELPALNLNEGTTKGLTECLEDWILL
mgnify:CR=1 FL=1